MSGVSHVRLRDWAARAGLLLLAALAAGCASGAGSPVATQVAAWTSGPLRWLLLPEDERALERVNTPAELAAFELAFWRRRESTPPAARPIRTVINERIAAADRLYGEPDRPGSLSDRGRALVLLGSPYELKALRRPVPVWQVSPEGRPRIGSRLARVEIWGYRSEDIARELHERLAERLGEERLELTFLAEDSRMKLVAGEALLEQAVRSLVHVPDSARR